MKVRLEEPKYTLYQAKQPPQITVSVSFRLWTGLYKHTIHSYLYEQIGQGLLVTLYE